MLFSPLKKQPFGPLNRLLTTLSGLHPSFMVAIVRHVCSSVKGVPSGQSIVLIAPRKILLSGFGPPPFVVCKHTGIMRAWLPVDSKFELKTRILCSALKLHPLGALFVSKAFFKLVPNCRAASMRQAPSSVRGSPPLQKFEFSEPRKSGIGSSPAISPRHG